MGLLSSSNPDEPQSVDKARSEREREGDDDRRWVEVRNDPSYKYVCKSCGFGVNEIVRKCGQCGHDGKKGKYDYRADAHGFVALSFTVILAPITLPLAFGGYALSLFSGKGESPWEGVSRKEYVKEVN